MRGQFPVHIKVLQVDLHQSGAADVDIQLVHVVLLRPSTWPEINVTMANRTGCGARRRVRRSASTASRSQRSNAPVLEAKNTFISGKVLSIHQAGFWRRAAGGRGRL
jgi:hypothetical protein